MSSGILSYIELFDAIYLLRTYTPTPKSKPTNSLKISTD